MHVLTDPLHLVLVVAAGMVIRHWICLSAVACLLVVVRRGGKGGLLTDTDKRGLH